MKICDIVQSYTESSGGIRTYLRAKQQFVAARARLEHVLIVPGARDSWRRDGPLTTYTVRGFRVPGSHSYRFTFRLRSVGQILERERPRVIEMGSAYVLPWAALRYREGRRAALVGYYHTDYPAAYVETFVRSRVGARPGATARRLAEAYVREVYNRFDATVTSSPAMQARLRRIGVRDRHLIPLGVDMETFDPKRRDRAVWRRRGIADNEAVIVFSGRLDHEKAVLDLVDAVRRLPDTLRVRLALIGAGPLAARLREEAARDPRVLVIEYLHEKRELATLLASADLYATAGPHETFGLSVLEAQACALPVVGVRAGALVDRVRPGLGRLARPGSPENLSRALADTLAGDLVGMGAAARVLVEQEYSWETCLGRLLDLYVDLAGPARAAAASVPERSLATGYLRT